jgi:ankyrin repeat protein
MQLLKLVLLTIGILPASALFSMQLPPRKSNKIISSTRITPKQRKEATQELSLLLHNANYNNSGDEERVSIFAKTKKLLAKGANPNGCEELDHKPLITASGFERSEIAHFLLLKGANPNISNGDTPLTQAAKNNKGHIVSLLLEYHADPNIPCTMGTPLHIAINNPPLAALLLPFTTNINAQAFYNSHTALMDAKDPQIITWLLAHGADVNIQDFGGNTALMYNAVRLLSDQLDAIKLLLTAHADPNIQNKEGITTLHICAYYLPALNLLLEHGADPNITTTRGETVLMRAANWSSPETVATLLNNGAHIDAQNNSGKTALIRATEGDRPKIESIKTLLDHKADPNIKDNKGNTALLYATKFNTKLTTDLINLLLTHGANPCILDCKGNSPLHFAAGIGNIDQIKSIIFYARDFAQQSLKNLCTDKSSYISLLPLDVRKKIDAKLNAYINQTNDQGDTPLIVAVKRNCRDSIVRFLIESGADVTIRNLSGQSALDIAREFAIQDPQGYKETIKLLTPATNGEQS